MQKKEAILKNTVIENVCTCLHDTLKDIEEQDFFTASRWARYHSFSVYEYNDEINVDYSITVYPDDPEKLFRWYTGTAFIFKALQLQTNTVKLKAECHPVDLHSVFDSYWDKILKDF